MKLVTMRELRGKAAALRRDLVREQELVLTANGKPFAVVTRIDPEHLEEDLRALRGARARIALQRMQEHAKATGFDKLTMGEIDALIGQVRRERKPR